MDSLIPVNPPVDHMFSQEEVQAICDWFKDKDLPKDLRLSSAHYFADLQYSLTAMSKVALGNYQHAAFNGNIHHLLEIRQALIDMGVQNKE